MEVELSKAAWIKGHNMRIYCLSFILSLLFKDKLSEHTWRLNVMASYYDLVIKHKNSWINPFLYRKKIICWNWAGRCSHGSVLPVKIQNINIWIFNFITTYQLYDFKMHETASFSTVFFVMYLSEIQRVCGCDNLQWAWVTLLYTLSRDAAKLWKQRERHQLSWARACNCNNYFGMYLICKYLFLVQVRLRIEVLCTPSSTWLGFELMTYGSWQYIYVIEVSALTTQPLVNSFFF